jgi:hypothetical protein
MEMLNESLSKEFDYSFCIEKEIARHYLYDAAERMIENNLSNCKLQEEVVNTLSLWFQHISSQLLFDIQKFYIINRLSYPASQKVEKSLIENLIVGYELIYYLKKKMEQYQMDEQLLCHHLIFVLAGLKKNYGDFLLTINPSLIEFLTKKDNEVPIVRSKKMMRPDDVKVVVSHRAENKHKPWINMNMVPLNSSTRM